MLVAGIDTGLNGAIVLLDTLEKTAHFYKLKYRSDELIDSVNMFQCLPELKNSIVYIEKTRGRGMSTTDKKAAWGSSQNFGMGANYGKLRQLFETIPYHLVEPKSWQKYAHEGTNADSAKLRSMQAFVRLNPDAKIKHNGIIDAFFIARFGLIKAHQAIYDNWNFIDASK